VAITFVGDGSDTQNSNTISVPWPSTSNNDVAVLFWRYRTNLGTVTGPSGWTELGTRTTSTDACRVYYRVCNGSESGSVNLNVAGTAGKQQGILVVYRGVDTTTPINASNSIASLDPPAVTTTVADTTIIISTSVRSSTLATFTVPAGYTFRGGDKDLGTTGGGASTLGVADSITTRSAGSVNPDAYGSTISTNAISWTVALRPGASGTDYNETATALSTDVSLGSVSATRSTSTGSGSLGTSAGLSGAGSTVAASASADLDVVTDSEADAIKSTSGTASLDTDAYVTASGTAAASSSTSLDTDVSVPSTGIKGTSTDADPLTSGTSLSSSGTASASASSSLDTEASFTSSGVADAASDAELVAEFDLSSSGNKSTSSDASFDTVAEFVATGGIASESDAAALSSDVSTSSTGTVSATTDADALSLSAPEGTADTEGDGTATTPGLLTEVSLTATGTVSANSDASLETDAGLAVSGSVAAETSTELSSQVTIGSVDSGAGFLASVSQLAGSVGVSSSGSVSASTDAEHLSAEMSSEPYPWVELVSAANLLEALVLFDQVTSSEGNDSSAEPVSMTFDLGPVDSFLTVGSTTIFSTTIELDADSTAAYVGDADLLYLEAGLSTAGTESDPTAIVLPLTFSVTMTSVAGAGLSDQTSFESLLEMEETPSTYSTLSDSELLVQAEHGTATIYQDPFELLVSMSVTETVYPATDILTEIDDPMTVTEIPGIGIVSSVNGGI
jgi:hypothetical protein